MCRTVRGSAARIDCCDFCNADRSVSSCAVAAVGFRFHPTARHFSDMENTQENSASQNPTPADDTARQTAEPTRRSRKPHAATVAA